MIRAKFRVESHTKYSDPAIIKITMRAVCDDDTEENSRFYKYTPSGLFEMTTNNPLVIEQMTPGKYFYLDFTETQ